MCYVGDTIYILSGIGNLRARLWGVRLSGGVVTWWLGGLGVVLGWWGGDGPWLGGSVGCPWFWWSFSLRGCVLRSRGPAFPRCWRVFSSALNLFGVG